MGLEERTLELNLMSAQNLKKVKNYGHQTCYAVAYIASSDKKASKVDKDGGVNPTWNTKLTITCDEKLLQRGSSCITVEIYSHGIFSNKLVGTSKISLLEIGKQAVAAAPPKFLTFEVHRRSGKVHGVLHLSVKVGEKRYIAVQGRSGTPFLGFSERCKRQQLLESAPIGYPEVFPPTTSSPKRASSVTLYPPPRTGAVTPYPAPAPKFRYESSVAHSNIAYPPPTSPLRTNIMSIPKADEPVMAYPTSGHRPAYPSLQYGKQYGGQYYGSDYVGEHQSCYPSTELTAPKKNEKVHYSKPTRRRHDHSRCCKNSRGTSGMGTGLLGGVLGGLLLGV